MKLRVYFAFRSPYSWMALKRLKSRVPDCWTRFEMIPYWDPGELVSGALEAADIEVLYTPMSKAKHLYLLADTKRIADKLGYRLAWPIDIDPQWDPIHLAWFVAQEHGKAEEFYEAVAAARWERGECVYDPEVLAALLDRCGLPDSPPSGPELVEQAVEAYSKAYYDDVFGIPFFINGRHRFWGLDRLDHFLETITAPSAAQVAPVLPAGPALAYDSDTAGGCG